MSQLTIYTDGAARGNPGNGGYGAVLQWGDAMKEISQGYRHTTNNRMELMGVIAALQLLTRPGLDITIYTDSAYIVNSIEKKWVFGWAQKGFKDKKNPDLWRRFLGLYPKHQIQFKWIKGHAGHALNERCDQLATEAADGGNLLVDTWYENEQKSTGLAL